MRLRESFITRTLVTPIQQFIHIVGISSVVFLGAASSSGGCNRRPMGCDFAVSGSCHHRIAWGIALGLVIGKPLGIIGFSMLRSERALTGFPTE